MAPQCTVPTARWVQADLTVTVPPASVASFYLAIKPISAAQAPGSAVGVYLQQGARFRMFNVDGPLAPQVTTAFMPPYSVTYWIADYGAAERRMYFEVRAPGSGAPQVGPWILKAYCAKPPGGRAEFCVDPTTNTVIAAFAQG